MTAGGAQSERVENEWKTLFGTGMHFLFPWKTDILSGRKAVSLTFYIYI